MYSWEKKSWTKGKVKELRYLFFHFLSIHEFLKILNFGRYNGSCVFKNSPWITLLSSLILIKLNHHGLHLCLRTVVSTKCGARNWIFFRKVPVHVNGEILHLHALSSTDVSDRQNNIKVVAQDETASFLRSVFIKSERKCQIENFLQVIQIGKFPSTTCSKKPFLKANLNTNHRDLCIHWIEKLICSCSVVVLLGKFDEHPRNFSRSRLYLEQLLFVPSKLSRPYTYLDVRIPNMNQFLCSLPLIFLNHL